MKKWLFTMSMAGVMLSALPTVADAYGSQLPIGLIPNMMDGAVQSPTMVVWSMYPAAVRGRVFGGQGGDPLLQAPMTSGNSSGW